MGSVPMTVMTRPIAPLSRPLSSEASVSPAPWPGTE
jgi:hypothetical protein